MQPVLFQELRGRLQTQTNDLVNATRLGYINTIKSQTQMTKLTYELLVVLGRLFEPHREETPDDLFL